MAPAFVGTDIHRHADDDDADADADAADDDDTDHEMADVDIDHQWASVLMMSTQDDERLLDH